MPREYSIWLTSISSSLESSSSGTTFGVASPAPLPPSISDHREIFDRVHKSVLLNAPRAEAGLDIRQ